ncbi:MAG: hypothetical protein CMQ54_00570 [Gammaproteobacteria bacterium]|jgi:nitrogen fixation NifU-like protein|nr:hypothetical protein [Gammaproteobacteria bacterium]|tara:strand:+ start:74 stop:445 length:372 start_codon:yes stop_codon:yes gene_type:complete
MSIVTYNQCVRDYFSNPTHAGDFLDGVTSYINDQGIRIKLSAKVSDQTVIQLCFLAWGCPYTIAATEFFCKTYEGSDIQDLEQFEITSIMHELAVPIERTGRILVLEDAVHSLIAAINDRESK